MARMSGSDWRSKVVAEVAAKTGNKLRSRYVSRLNIEIPAGGLLPMLALAAKRRGCSPTTYVRRAMMAYLARDLAVPFDMVVKLDPRFTEPHGRNAIDDPKGELGGPWEIP